MVHPPLMTEHVQANFDEQMNLIRLSYLGDLPPTGPGAFYEWLYELADAIEIANVRGGLIDVRSLTNYPVMTLGSSVKGAKVLNQRIDLSQLPVAYIVQNLYQRQFAQMFIQLAPQSNRRKIVESPEEGLQFIEEWHKINHKHP